MAAPNVVNVVTITGKTAVQIIGITPIAIITNAAASGKVLKVNALYISNVDGTIAADVTVDLFRASVAYRIARTITVPAKSTLDIISKSLYLEEGDSLRLTASIALDLEGVCSYEDIS